MGATIRIFILALILLWGIVAWRLRQRCVTPVSQSAGGM
jgi:hypothetical protein